MRTIARIDVKNEYVIKGIHLEGLRKIGNPNEIAVNYYQQGIDEIVFMDAVASLYDRNNLFGIIEKACEEVFVPITIGGGIRTLEDISSALMSGADKVAVNTGAVRDPGFVTKAALKFGNQCIVASIEAKRQGDHWEVYVDNGREKTGLEVVSWAKKLESLGAGELLLTSIDKEGTKQGFDLELIEAINSELSIPVVASGGCGKLEHIDSLGQIKPLSGVAIASLFHYNLASIDEAKLRVSDLEKTRKGICETV